MITTYSVITLIVGIVFNNFQGNHIPFSVLQSPLPITMTNDITSLIEIFLSPGEEHPVLHDYPEHLVDTHNEFYKHIVCDDEGMLWYCAMTTVPIEEEWRVPILLQRLALIDLEDRDEVDCLLTTHYVDCGRVLQSMQAPAVGFDDVLKCTHGFILYKWQAEVIYRVYTLCTEEEARLWVRQWNKKVPEARHTDYFIEGQLSLLQVLEEACYDRKNQFFCSVLIPVKAVR